MVEKKSLKKNIFLENEQDLIETIIHFITKRDRKLQIQNELMDDYSKQKRDYEDWNEELEDLSNTNY